MHNQFKSSLLFVITNLLASYCGTVFFNRSVHPDQLVVVKVTPRIGKSLATTPNGDDPGQVQTELLDNAFVWVKLSGYVGDPVEKDQKVSSVWFDFDGFSARYKKRLYLTWEYKGRSYMLDETVTPAVLKASFHGIRDLNRYDHRIIYLCDDSITVEFNGDKISRVELGGAEE